MSKNKFEIYGDKILISHPNWDFIASATIRDDYAEELQTSVYKGYKQDKIEIQKKCLSPAKKHKLYKSSINKSIHFVQRSLSSSPRVPYPVPVPNKKI